MEKLTGKEIVAIIRAGKDASLVKFELGELKIEFQATLQAAEISQSNQHTFPEPVSTAIERQPDKTNLQTLAQELDRELLMLTDPQLYEEQQLLGDAFDEKT